MVCVYNIYIYMCVYIYIHLYCVCIGVCVCVWGGECVCESVVVVTGRKSESFSQKKQSDIFKLFLLLKIATCMV